MKYDLLLSMKYYCKTYLLLAATGNLHKINWINVYMQCNVSQNVTKSGQDRIEYF